MHVFESPAKLLEAVGTDLGSTEWIEVTQERIDQFAQATGDHQWIHTDPARATTESAYGATIAHGYLTLALTNTFLPELLDVRGASMGVNYGVDKVRFPAAAPAGSRLRGRAIITGAVEVPGGVQVTVTITVEREGGDRPVCVVESISRFLH